VLNSGVLKFLLTVPLPTPYIDPFAEKFTNGGVFIVSRWPIELSVGIEFSKCVGVVDCAARKGVLYARINKNGERFNIFGATQIPEMECSTSRRGFLNSIKCAVS
jgi:sphingomyelin phosphodiesterase